ACRSSASCSPVSVTTTSTIIACLRSGPGPTAAAVFLRGRDFMPCLRPPFSSTLEQSVGADRACVDPLATINGRKVVIALRTKATPTVVTAAAFVVSLGFGGLARAAEQWNFYMHQSAPNFATSRGAKLFTEEIDKATNGDFKVRLHLSGTLQINASNITQAVGENVVQLGDDLFNSGNIPVAGIPRLPMLIQSYEDFAKADAVLKPYIEKAFGQKGSTVLSSYSYPMQVIWGRKKLESLDDLKGMKLRVAQPEQGEFVRRFGGTSITMSAPEVPSALDRGVVEGIFTAGVGAVLWKDLLKYGYLLVVNVNNSYFIANTDAYLKPS